MKEQTCHQFLLQHSAYADVLEKTHSKETEWAKHHKPYEKAMPIRKKFTAKLKEEQNASTFTSRMMLKRGMHGIKNMEI